MSSIGGTRALFVSPHLDDVAFSCGATVARSASRDERPLIVTLCTSEPDSSAALSELARTLHEKWNQAGTPAAQLWANRRAEDLVAIAELGATHRWLGYPDAIYRGYESSQTLLGAPSARDAPFIAHAADEIVALWQQTERAIVYLPLALGGHVDHRVACALAPALREAGATVWHYEDFPYSAPDGTVEQHLAGDQGWRFRIEDVTEHFARRLAAMSAYASQLAPVFRKYGGEHEPITRQVAEARAGASGHFAERFWQRDDG